MLQSGERLRAMEIGGSAALGFCGRVLHDLGIAVERLAPPSELLERRARIAAFLDAGKTVHAFSLESLPAALDGVAVVLVDSWALDELDLSVEALRRAAPAAVVAMVELPALPAHLRTDDAASAAIEALSGLMLLRVADDDRPVPHRSLALPYAAGLLLAVAALVALIADRDRTESQWVEVRALDAALLLVEGIWVAYPHLGVSPSGRWTRISQLRVMRCADGYVAPIFRGQDGWERLCLGLLDRPDLVADPRFATLDARANHMEELRGEVAGWFASRDRDAVFDAALELQLPFGKFLRLEEQFDDPQNQHRSFFVERATSGGLERALRLPFSWRRGIHGAHTHHGQEAHNHAAPPAVPPLSGMRVIEMGMYWAGPLAARILAELGADVVKLESPHNFDPSRYSNIADNTAAPSPWERGWTTMTAAGKRSATLDLGSAAGRDAFRAVLERTDLLIANTSARVLPNLGLDPHTLCEDFPNLTVIQMTGYGADGPYRTYPAFGIALEAISGLAFLADSSSGVPVTVASTLSDPIAGLFAAVAAIARYAGLGAAGNGVVDLSERECVLWMAGDLLTSGGESMSNPTVARTVVRCADGWLLALANEANPLLDGSLQRSADRTRGELAALVSAGGGVAFPIRTAEEVAHAPELLGRGLLPVRQPVIGWRLVPGCGIRFERSGTLTGRPSRLFGSDTRDVLREAGLPEEQIDRLFRDGVAALQPNPVPAVQMIDLESMERLGAVARRDPEYRAYLTTLGLRMRQSPAGAGDNVTCRT